MSVLQKGLAVSIIILLEGEKKRSGLFVNQSQYNVRHTAQDSPLVPLQNNVSEGTYFGGTFACGDANPSIKMAKSLQRNGNRC